MINGSTGAGVTVEDKDERVGGSVVATVKGTVL